MAKKYGAPSASELEYYARTSGRWNNIAYDMDKAKEAPRVYATPERESVPSDDSYDKPKKMSHIDKIVDWADGTAKWYMNGLDNTKINEMQGDIAKNVSPSMLLLDNIENVVSDPDFGNVIRYINEFKKLPLDKRASHVNDYDVKNNRPIKYDFSGIDTSKSIFEPVYKTARYSKNVPIAAIPMYGINEALGNESALVTSEQGLEGKAKLLPGLNDVPARLRGPYARLSGWIAKYLEKQDELDLPTLDILYMNGLKDPHVVNRISGAKERLVSKMQNNTNEIVERQRDIRERAPASDYYNKLREEGDFMYKFIPDIGQSMSQWTMQAGNFAFNIGMNTLAKSVAAPEAAVPIAVATVAGDLASAWVQRKGETNSEYGDAWNRKFDSSMKSMGSKPLMQQSDYELVSQIIPGDESSSIYNKARQEMSMAGELSPETKTRLISGLKSGIFKSKDKNVSKAIQSSDKGANEFYRQQMALSTADAAQALLMVTPIKPNGMFKRIGNDIVDVLSDGSKVQKGIAKTVKGLDSFYKNTIGKVYDTKIIGPAAKYVTKSIGVGLSEGHEELAQGVISARYEAGKLPSSTAVESLFESYKGGLTGLGAVLGYNKDEKYLNKYELLEQGLSGFYNGMLMHGVFGAAGKVAEYAIDRPKVKKAEAFVNNAILSNLRSKDIIQKAGAYVDAEARKRMPYVMDILEGLKNNPPEDFTKEDIEAQIKMANDARYIYNQKPIKDYVKNNTEFGSPEHKRLVGLLLAHNDSIKTSSAESMKLSSDIDSAIDHHMSIDTSYSALINSKNKELASSAKEGDEIDQIDDSESRLIYKLANEIKSIESALELHRDDKIESEEKAMDDVEKQFPTKYSTVKNSLSNRLKYKINKFKEASRGLSVDDIVDTVDDTLLSKMIAKESIDAGIEYDSKIYNGLLGANQFGPSQYQVSKMGKESHYAFVNHFVNKLKESERNDEIIETELSKKEQEIKKEESKPSVISEPHFGEIVSKTSPDVSIPVADGDAIPTAAEEQPTSAEAEEKSAEEPITEEDLFGGMSESAKTKSTEEKKSDRADDNNPSQDLSENSDMFDGDYGADVGVEAELASDEVESELKGIIGQSDDLVQKLLAQKREDESKGIPADMPSHEAPEANIANQIQGETIKANLESTSVTMEVESDSKELHSDAISHTLFFLPTSTKATREGFRTGAQLKDLLDSDGSISNCEFEINVSRYTDDKGVTSESIAILIEKKDGEHAGKYIAYLRDPAKVELQIEQLEKKIAFTTSPQKLDELNTTLDKLKAAYDNLIAFRHEVSSEHRNLPSGSKLVPTKVSISDGEIDSLFDKNDNAIQRSVYDINGIGLPLKDGKVDFNAIGVGNTVIGISAGQKGSMDIRDYRDYSIHTLKYESNAGGIFLMVKGKKSGRPVPIKLNKARIGDLSKSTTDLIYDLAVNKANSSSARIYVDKSGKLSRTGIDTGKTASDILYFMINSKSIMSESDKSNFPFLIEKQFGISDSGMFVFGANEMSLDEARSVNGEKTIKEFIANNLNWSVEKSHLWGSNGDMKVSDLFPHIARLINNKNLEKVSFTDDFVISKDDLSLTWTAYLIKTNKLKTNVADGVFKTPYMYLEGVQAVKSGRSTNILTNEQSTVKTPVNAPEGYSANKTVEELNSDKNILDNVKSFDEIGAVKRFKRSGARKEFYGGNYSKINLAKEISWIKEKLGLSDGDIDILSDVISISPSKQAMGVMTADSITLWEAAEEGTGYHEAYHRVELLLLPPKDRKAIYDEARARIKSLKNANNKGIAEYLAEEFRTYMLTQRPNKKFSKINAFFRRMMRVVRSMFNLGYKGAGRLYRDIELGVFKGVSINKDSLREFNESYGDIGAFRFKDLNLKTIANNDEFNDVVDSLTYALLELSGFRSIDDAKNIDINLLKASLEKAIQSESVSEDRKDRFREILDNMDNIFLPEINKSLELVGLTEEEIEDNSTSHIKEEVGSHTKVAYQYSLEEGLSADVRMFIKTIPKCYHEGDELVMYESPLLGFPKFVDFGEAWNKTSTQLSEGVGDIGGSDVDGMMARIKKLAETDPFFDMLDIRLSEVSDDNFITKFWISTNNMIHNFIDVGYSKVKEGGAEKMNVFVSNSEINRRSSQIPKEWGIYFANNPNIYKYDEDGYSFSNSHLKYIVDRYNDTKGIIQTTKRMLQGRLSSIKVEAADGSLIDYDLMTKEGVSIFIDEFVYMHNSVGIMIDNNSVSQLIAEGQNANRASVLNAIEDLVLSKNGSQILFNKILKDVLDNDGVVKKGSGAFISKVSPEQVFTKESYIRRLAESYAHTHPDNTESMILGPDGAMMYKVSLKDYISEKMLSISNDVNTMAEYLVSTYNKGVVDESLTANERGSHALSLAGIKNGVPTGSLAIKQILTGESNGIELGSFIKFYKDRSGDKGRDYTSISSAEDYVAKMTAVKNNYMILETMADKKRFYFLKGLKLPHANIRFVRQILKSGNYVDILFPQEHLSILSDYFKAELASVKDAYSQYKAANGNNDELIDIYHINGVDQDNGGKKWSGGHGNALRFRYFGSMTSSSLIGDKVVAHNSTINEYIDNMVAMHGNSGFEEAIKNIEDSLMSDELVECKIRNPRYNGSNNMFDTVMMTELEATINSSLKDNLWDHELPYLSKLGLINFNGEIDKLSNNSLPIDSFKSDLDNSDYKGDRLSGYETQGAILNAVADNMVNTMISNIEFGKLIMKDPAFYKDHDAQMKRHSSVLSTGNPLRQSWPSGHEMNGVDSFTVSEMNDNQIASNDHSVIERIFISQTTKELLEELGVYIDNISDIINNHYLPEDQINIELENEYIKLSSQYKDQFTNGELIGKSNSNGYGLGEKGGNINETDATVYISPSMYKKIVIQLGEWTPELQNAFDILESDGSDWLKDPSKYAEAIKLSVKPLKMIYFGDTIDKKNNLNVPVLDKMAMFCLFKSLAGGDLRHLYERMNNPADGLEKIDMVPFSSAVKVGNSKAISLYTDESNNSISDLSNMAVTKQQFKYLRRQLLTDPHHGAEIRMATQPIKASMSNIIQDKLYKNSKLGSNIKGSDIIDAWNKSINALSDRGLDSITKELGIRYNEDTGEYVFNGKKLATVLLKDAKTSGVGSDVIKMLKGYQKDGIVPVQAMADNQWIESRIISMIGKKTVDIDLNGGMFIQMTTFGLKSIDAKDFFEGRITEEEFKSRTKDRILINNGNKLKFFNEEDRSMECAISINLFKDVIPSDIKKLDFISQKNWLVDNNIIGSASEPLAIGYRVPTQGLSSISGLKVADVLPENIGDVIVLPSEFTKLTGSDFDIDKLFLARYSFKDGKKVEFDNSIEDPYKNNSEAAIKNRLLDCMLSVINDFDNTIETRLPLDTVTDELKDVILKDIESISKADKKSYPFQYITPAYQSRKKSEYIGGKSGISPFALHNSNHPLTQMTKLEFNSFVPILKHGLKSLHGIKGRDGKRILDWLSAMINAHVDVAKDPFIVRLGVNPLTYKMTNFLLRTGVGGDTFYFLSQDILKDASFNFATRSGEYGLSEEYSTDAENKSIAFAYNKYMSLAKNAANGDTDKLELLKQSFENFDDKGNKVLENEHVLNRDFLSKSLKSKDSFDWYFDQLMILCTYEELSPFSSKLSELVKFSQIDNKKYGSSFQEMRAFKKGVDSIRFSQNSVFENVNDYFSNTFLDRKMKNTLDMASAITNGMLFRTTKSVESFVDQVTTLFGKGDRASMAIVSDLTKAIDSHIKSEFFTGIANDRDVNIKSLFFGDDTMAKRLYRILDKINSKDPLYIGLADNGLIKSIMPKIAKRVSGAENQLADHVQLKKLKSNTTREIDALKEGWMDIIEHPIKEISDFGKDMILYQYFSSGDASTSNSIKLDEEERKNIGFYDFVAKALSKLRSSDIAFDNFDEALEDIISNRWYNDNLVPEVKTFTTREGYDFGETIIENKPYVPSPVNLKGGGKYNLLFIDETARPTYKEPGVVMFRPYVKVKVNDGVNGQVAILYKLVAVASYRVSGMDRMFPVYKAINKKGTRNEGFYIVENGVGDSIIDSNILPRPLAKGENIINIFNEYNSKNKSNMISNQEISMMAEKFSSIYPITTFNLKFSERDNVFDSPAGMNSKERLTAIRNIVYASVLDQVSNNVYGFNSIQEELEDYGLSSIEIEASKYLYGSLISSEYKASELEVDESTNLPIESPENELKMRVKAYSDALKDGIEEYANYFDSIYGDIKDNKAVSGQTSVKHSFDNQNEAALDLDKYKIKTGDIISIGGELFSVKNEENEDIEFNPIDQTDYTWDDFVRDNSVSDEEFQYIIGEKEDEIPMFTNDDIKGSDLSFAGVPINLRNIGITFKLNSDQSTALNEISNWYLSPDKSPYCLIGSAGSGKTSVTKIIASAVRQYGKNKVALSAPTNHQAKVLSNLAGQKATTIHRLLGLIPGEDIESETDIQFEGAGKIKIPYNGLVIVDEVSMVNDSLLDDILAEAMQRGSKVLFIGDDKQLDPIGNDGRQSKAFYFDNKSTLSKIERQSEKNPLSRIVNYFRTRIDSSENIHAFSEMNEEGGTYFLPASKESDLIKYSFDNFYNTESFKNNRQFVKWIAYTNDKVDYINNRIREMIGRGIDIEAEDLVVAKKGLDRKTSSGSKIPILENANSYEVESASEYVDRLFNPSFCGTPIKGKLVKLKNNDTNKSSEVFVPSLSNEDFNKVRISMSNAYRIDRQSFFRSMPSDLAFMKNVELVDENGNVIKKHGRSTIITTAAIKFDYASTAHSAQGRQFSNVFIQESDMQIAEEKDTKENYRRLVYVASSRAVNNLFGITSLDRYTIDRSNPDKPVAVRDTNESLLNIPYKTEMKTVESLWSEYGDTIKDKHPDADISVLEELSKEMNMKELEDYINKCYK